MVDTKNKTNGDSKTSKDIPSSCEKRMEHIALYKSYSKSEWTLFPQIFVSKTQAEHKIKLSVKAEKVHVIKLDLPD